MSSHVAPGDDHQQGRKHSLSSSLSSTHTTKSYKSIARDRFKHSHLGSNIPASRHGPNLTMKKGGAGGKFTAGQLLESQQEEGEEQLDPHDPNYDEDEVTSGLSASHFQPSHAALQLFTESFNEYQRFKSHLISELDNYLGEKNDKELFHAALKVAQSLKDLDLQDYHYDVVYILVKWDIENGSDGKASEMERIVKLVKVLHDHNGCVLTPQQIDLGLRKLYNSLDDMLLEHPNAKSVLHQYVVAFESGGLTEYTWQDEMEELEKQAELLKDQATDKKLHQAIDKLLDQYIKSEDLDALASMIAKHFYKKELHFEIVKCSMIKALQSGSNKTSELINEMLAAFVGDIISFESASAGILHFLENCEEIEDEYTNVLSFLSCFLARCIADHVVGLDILSCNDMVQRKLAAQIMAQTKHLLKGKGAAAKLQKVWQISDTGLSPALKPMRSLSTGSSSPTIASIGSPLSLGGRRMSSSGAPSSHSKPSTDSPGFEKRRLSLGGSNPFEGFVIGAKKPGTAAFELEKMKKDSPTAKKGAAGKDSGSEDASLVAEKERLDSFGYYDPAKMRGAKNSVFNQRARYM